MKESINLVSTPAQSPQPAYDLTRFRSQIKTGCAVLGAVLAVEIFASLLLNFQLGRELRARNVSERKLTSLRSDAQMVNSLLTRQKQLDYIEKQRLNLKKLVSLVQGKMPQDLALTNLKVEKGRVVVSAKTLEVSSFSQFVNGLVSTKYFKKISLTQSAYSEESRTFSFTLECLTN